MIHELKTWPEYFEKVFTGEKTFEVRKLDRFFNVGDTLALKEWSPVRWQEAGGYSGREAERKVTYVMNGGKWDIPEGICIMGLSTASSPIECDLYVVDCGGQFPYWQAVAKEEYEGYPEHRRIIVKAALPLPVESKWISVKDRLPENGHAISCLCYDKHHSQIRVLSFNKYHHCWDDESGDDYYTDAVGGNVTHWRELIEPPKQ